MSCERYKKAVIEAAASGARAPNGAAGEHINSCTDCREFFAREQALFAAIDTAAQRISNNEMPASLLAGVQAALVRQPARIRRPTLVWAPVAVTLLLVVSLTAWMVRHRSSAPSEIQPIAANNPSPAVTSEPRVRKTPPVSVSRIGHPNRSNASVGDADFRSLVPAGQSAQIDQLIKKIQSGGIRGEVLATKPDQELQIPPIVIPPLTVDVADEESLAQPGASGIVVSEPSLGSNRSTR
jgi:hypothetical protein